MNKPATIVFDFDGTLADTFGLTVDIFYGMRPRAVILPKKEVDRLRGMAITEVLRELNIRWWEAPIMLMRGKRIMMKRMHEATIIMGMDEVIKQLHADGHELHVVSSNSVTNIKKLFDAYHLTEYFTTIHGNARVHGKARILRKLAAVHPDSTSAVYYIGDEVRDIIAAKKAGVRSIAVSWGYNNIHVLHEHKPDELVSEPEKITEIVKTWKKSE